MGLFDLISERILGGLDDPFGRMLHGGSAKTSGSSLWGGTNTGQYTDFLSALMGRGQVEKAPDIFQSILQGLKGGQAPTMWQAAKVSPIAQAATAPQAIQAPPVAPQALAPAPAPPTTPITQGGSPLGPIYREVGQEYGIPPQVLQALGKIESGDNPQAVSPTGSHYGVGQIEASWFAPGENPFDPRTNIEKMALVLLTKLQAAQADKPNATWEDAVARYYGGTLEQPLSPEPGVPGPDTRGYVELWRQAGGEP